MLWLIVIASVVLLASWLVVLAFKFPLWIALVVSALLVLVVGAVFGVRALRGRLRAVALERELLRQAAQQAERVRPDRRGEIFALRAQMKSALDALKRSKLGSRGRAALYDLPWYVIVGPPAAGKTTALSQSGLGFITPEGVAGAKLRGTAGTKNCDWWFSQHAILLDTAGRFSTQEDDRDEWFGFLDILRQFRSERPLDGVVVAVSVEELFGANEEQAEELVARLRARVDELVARLDMVLPVYVMFTKLDLVAGFVEFWGDLSKPARAQAWGASFALDDQRVEDLASAVEAEFDLLLRVLHAQTLTRVAHEPQPAVRSRILQFPLEFEALRQPVARFLEALGRANPYQETPFVRGFYFTSGTQTGRALDRVLGGMARGFELHGLAAAPALEQAQSFFVRDLFSKVVFPDRHLAVRSLRKLRGRSLRQAAWAASAVLLTGAVVTAATVSYLDNSALISDTHRDQAEAAAGEDTGSAEAAAWALDLLLTRSEQLEQARANGSMLGLWGPYVAPELERGWSGIYRQRLLAMVDGPVQAELVADVREAGDAARVDSRNFLRSYQDLKLYVMLTQPAAHLDPDYAAERLAAVWARALHSSAPSDQRRLLSHARRYVAELKRDPALAFQPDASALARAQGRLAQIPIDDLRFSWLSEVARGAPPIRPESIFFGPASEYWSSRGNVQVPGLYTALGWSRVRKLFEAPDARFEFEPWVLGQSALDEQRDSRKDAAERLETLYFQRYAAAWSDFLSGLAVTAPAEPREAVRELRVLAESDGPYVRLFRALSDNLRLDLQPESLSDRLLAKGHDAVVAAVASATGADAGAASERPVSAVERHFQPLLKFGFAEGKGDAAPTGLSQYLAYLNQLEVALSDLVDAHSDPSADLAQELSRTSASVQRLLAGLDVTTRQLLEPLLMNPIRGSRAGVVHADFSALSDKWKTEVWDTYQNKILPRYPFSNSPNEVSLPEFSDFFRPQTGTIWAFFKANLEGRLERSGNSFVPKGTADAAPFRPDFLQCLSVAQEITDAIFGSANEPSLGFSIRIHPVGVSISEVALSIDGKASVYRNEPERWTPAQWPGKGELHGATLQVRGADFTDEIPRMGDFGLFRLLHAGGIRASGQSEGAPILVSTWTLTRAGSDPVTIDVKPAKIPNPFDKDFFHRFRCPAQASLSAPAVGAR